MAVVKAQFSLRLDLVLHAKIKKIAEAQGGSLTTKIVSLIQQEIDGYEAENGEIKVTEEDISLP